MTFTDDTFVFEQIKNEQLRQQNGIELIASENFVSPSVLRLKEAF